MPISTYTSVSIVVTVLTVAHLASFIVFVTCLSEKPTVTLSRRGRPTIATSFNLSIFTMLISLIIMFCAETAAHLSLDFNVRFGKIIDGILVMARVIGFDMAEIGYINYSYDRAKGIFDRTLPPGLATGLCWVVKTLPLQFLPPVTARAVSVCVSDPNQIALSFMISRWYGAAVAIFTFFLDMIFLVTFVVFLHSNIQCELGSSIADESMAVVAQYGAVGSFVFLATAGSLLAFAGWVKEWLRLLAYIMLSVVSVVLTALKVHLHRDRERRRSTADARLKNVLGSAELRRIRSRETLNRYESPKVYSDAVFVGLNDTLKCLEAV
ncbi:hypothetical protein BJ741DRAFT_607771 [Chytriomyces cf. hyalinus JEL632]|nr:hypothetical protein BJ741DRAFT_607771 [Chytriomyces cf. hyalinus JEL632]